MPQVTCAFCGSSFSARHASADRTYFCCSGCALASRIPVHDDALPVSRELIVALALGFGLFNQLLLVVFGAALAADERIDFAMRMFWISSAIGVVVLLTQFALLAFAARARRWTDSVAGVIALALATCAVWRGTQHEIAAGAWTLLAANAPLALWLSRGWLRRAMRRRAHVTEK